MLWATHRDGRTVVLIPSWLRLGCRCPYRWKSLWNISMLSRWVGRREQIRLIWLRVIAQWQPLIDESNRLFSFFLSFSVNAHKHSHQWTVIHSFIHTISFARAACLYVLRTCVHLSETRVKYQQREKYPDYERRQIEWWMLRKVHLTILRWLDQRWCAHAVSIKYAKWSIAEQ